MSFSKYLIEEHGYFFVGDKEYPYEYEYDYKWNIEPLPVGYFTFCVARNPIERFKSYYRYVVQHQQKYNGNINDFVKEHYKDLEQQYRYLQNSNYVIRYDMLYKYDTHLGYLLPNRYCLNKTENMNVSLSDESMAILLQHYRLDYKHMQLLGLL